MPRRAVRRRIRTQPKQKNRLFIIAFDARERAAMLDLAFRLTTFFLGFIYPA
jgi:hypothetical protein